MKLFLEFSKEKPMIIKFWLASRHLINAYLMNTEWTDSIFSKVLVFFKL